MEKYADNLEELVIERTGQLIEEKKKTDALLERMLPRYGQLVFFYLLAVKYQSVITGRSFSSACKRPAMYTALQAYCQLGLKLAIHIISLAYCSACKLSVRHSVWHTYYQLSMHTHFFKIFLFVFSLQACCRAAQERQSGRGGKFPWSLDLL